MSSGALAVGLVGLDVDALDPAAVDEVVDVGAAPGRRDGLVDLADIEAERARLVLVDVDVELRRVFEADRADADDALVLHRHAEQHVARLDQLGVADVAGVDQLEVEAGRVAELERGGRDEGDDQRVAILRTAPPVARSAMDLDVFALPVRSSHGLSVHEGDAGILALAGEGEAADGEHAFDIRRSRSSRNNRAASRAPRRCGAGWRRKARRPG